VITNSACDSHTSLPLLIVSLLLLLLLPFCSTGKLEVVPTKPMLHTHQAERLIAAAAAVFFVFQHWQAGGGAHQGDVLYGTCRNNACGSHASMLILNVSMSQCCCCCCLSAAVCA
jgi:hypothetical protein